MLALGVRVWGLGAKSLWLDEASSLAFAAEPLARILTNTSETNPPLYYALLHGWIAFFGTSEVALRSLSVIFGVASVGLVGWVGRLVGGRRMAWVAMALMTLMPMPVEYSQSVRGYSLFLAASLAAYGCLLAWERRPGFGWAAGYVGATLAAAYTHNYWVFTFLAQQLYLSWRTVRGQLSLARWLALPAAVFIGYLPWLFVAVSQATGIQAQGFWIDRPSGRELFETLRSYVTYDLRPSATWGYLLLVVWGLVAARRGGAGARILTLLLLWLAVPVLLPFAWSRVASPIFVARYTIAAVPAFYLLLGLGLLALPRWAAAAAVVAMVATAPVSLSRYYSYEKEAWRRLVQTVEAMADPTTDVVAVSHHGRGRPFFYYYRGHAPVRQFPLAVSQQQIGRIEQKLEEAVSGHQRLWLVVRAPRIPADPRSGRLLVRDLFLARYPDAALIYEREFSTNLVVYGYDVASEGRVDGHI